MSTKSKRVKLYSKQDLVEAEKSNDVVRRHYSRKTNRRKTVQIRMSEEWYEKLKELARKENLILSFVADEMCKHFLKHYK